VLRYVEANALRARLVDRAEEWRWGSLWRRCNSCNDLPLSAWPIPQSDDWIALVNEPQMPTDLSAIQVAIREGHPIGNNDWQDSMAPRFGLRLRQAGRPRK
jgi:putative transposase